MALLGSAISNEVGLRLLMCPLGSNIVVRTACCTVGVVLPVYSTLKAIENKNQREQEKWLVYWAVYGSFSVIEIFSDTILSWFPLYYYAKFAFLVWLQLPSNNGSKQLYARHLRPFLLRNQAMLDRLLNSAYGEFVRFISAHQEEIEYLKALLGSCAVKASQIITGVTRPAQPRTINTVEVPNGHPVEHNQELYAEDRD